MTRRTHRFRSAARDLIVAKALMRNAILKDPAILAALNRYIASLCLEGRIQTGQLSETQALIEFEKAIHFFTRRIHTELNTRSTVKNIDQTDLSIPINMQNALNNPLSVANILMVDTAATVQDTIINQAYENEQLYMQEMQNNEQAAQQAAITPEPTDNEETDDIEKTAALIGAVTLFDEKGPDAAKDVIESAFFKETGVKTEFHNEEPTEEVSSLLQKVLKPEFKDYQNNDKDKG